MLARVQQPRRRGNVGDGVSWSHALAQQGYAVVPGHTDVEAVERLLDGLGVIVHRTLVQVRPGIGTYLNSPPAVPLHTDHPAVDWIAWWCERQDALDGASSLVDAHQVVQALDRVTRTSLERVRLACPSLNDRATGEEPGRHPLLTPRRVYFAPWLQPKQSSTAHAWRTWTAAVAAAQRIHVRLQPGDTLVIDNRRMLHGRGALAEDSRRALRRYWVRASS